MMPLKAWQKIMSKFDSDHEESLLILPLLKDTYSEFSKSSNSSIHYLKQNQCGRRSTANER